MGKLFGSYKATQSVRDENEVKNKRETGDISYVGCSCASAKARMNSRGRKAQNTLGQATGYLV